MKTSIHAYLTFEGNCEEAFKFYHKVFGGKLEDFSRFDEMPPQEGFEIPENYKNNIMHVTLHINDSTLLMGSDIGPWSPKNVIGNNVSLSFDVPTKAEADRVFKELSADGKITMPMGDTFWGSYFGMCIDKYGFNWMVSFTEA